MLTLTLVMRMSLRSKDRWVLRGEQALVTQQFGPSRCAVRLILILSLGWTLTVWWVLKEVEVADEVVWEVSHSPGAMAKLSRRRGPWCKSRILALGR